MLPHDFTPICPLSNKQDPIFTQEYTESIKINNEIPNKLTWSDDQNCNFSMEYPNELAQSLKTLHGISIEKELSTMGIENFLTSKYLEIQSILTAVKFHTKFPNESYLEFLENIPKESFAYDESNKILYYKGKDQSYYDVNFQPIDFNFLKLKYDNK